MKKVLLITVRSDVGGGPQHVHDLLKYGTSEKVSFFIASPDEQPFGALFKNLASSFLEIPHRKFSLWSFFKMLIFVRENNISIVHSHGKGAGVYSRLLSLFGVRVIHTPHGVHSAKNNFDKFKNFIEIVLSKLTDKFIFVSPSEKDKAMSLGIGNGINNAVIFNGIPIDSSPSRSESNGVKIGILSRFDPHKNVKRGIELFSKLQTLHPQLKLTIAGDGEEGEYLKRLVKTLNLEQSVSFTGFIDNPLAFLKEQDFYLSTSLGEGLPYTVLEAMNVGATPILSKVSGHIDILPDDYLFDLNDDNDFIQKFESVRIKKDHNLKEVLKSKFEIKTQLRKVTEEYF